MYAGTEDSMHPKSTHGDKLVDGSSGKTTFCLRPTSAAATPCDPWAWKTEQSIQWSGTIRLVVLRRRVDTLLHHYQHCAWTDGSGYVLLGWLLGNMTAGPPKKEKRQELSRNASSSYKYCSVALYSRSSGLSVWSRSKAAGVTENQISPLPVRRHYALRAAQVMKAVMIKSPSALTSASRPVGDETDRSASRPPDTVPPPHRAYSQWVESCRRGLACASRLGPAGRARRAARRSASSAFR
jgi:hypothetical protein